MQESLETYLSETRELVEQFIVGLVSKTIDWPSHLRRAIHYSLFPGGKRLRPILVVAGYQAVASIPDLSLVLPFAAGVEFLHTYTMIHDDLPQLDDDDLRRGRPTNHRVHGEALALLAGDALQALAFQIMTNKALFPTGMKSDIILDIVHDIAHCCGEEGVIGGQSMDLGFEGEIRAPERLAYLYGRKTGDLLRASVLAGARVGEASPAQLRSLATYADRVGVAFQFTDDLLDEGETPPPETSARRRKVPSIVELIGTRGTRDWIDRATQEALQSLASFDGRADPLRALAHWIPSRKA